MDPIHFPCTLLFTQELRTISAFPARLQRPHLTLHKNTPHFEHICWATIDFLPNLRPLCCHFHASAGQSCSRAHFLSLQFGPPVDERAHLA
jgi:hypothetical protein